MLLTIRVTHTTNRYIQSIQSINQKYTDPKFCNAFGILMREYNFLLPFCVCPSVLAVPGGPGERWRGADGGAGLEGPAVPGPDAGALLPAHRLLGGLAPARVLHVVGIPAVSTAAPATATGRQPHGGPRRGAAGERLPGQGSDVKGQGRLDRKVLSCQ